MQAVSNLFIDIISGDYVVEYKVVIDDVTYGEDVVRSITISNSLFGGDVPMIGCAVSGQVDVEMHMPNVTIPRMAEVKPYARVTNGTQTSEWLQQGVYYIDTRSVTHDDTDLHILTIHGFDAMMRAEANYPSDDAENYPAIDLYVVQKIADAMDVEIDSRTAALMTKGYMINLPASYSQREVLENIASMYAANWTITEQGKLRLTAINSIGNESNFLVEEHGFAITFGSDRILVEGE